MALSFVCVNVQVVDLGMEKGDVGSGTTRQNNFRKIQPIEKKF